MNTRSVNSTVDRILLSERSRVRQNLPNGTRRSPQWTMAAGVVSATILLWTMVQMGQASPNPKAKPPAAPAKLSPASSAQATAEAAAQQSMTQEDGAPSLQPVSGIQGPMLDAPREVSDMLESRRRDLDRREEAIRRDEGRLMMVRADLEKLLVQNEALEKRILQANSKDDQRTFDAKAQKAKSVIEKERHQQEQKIKLARMYEAMPPEDAAARLEHMPDPQAIEILRFVKTKTAGTILAQVRPERAAKLTEQLLAQAK